MGNITEKEKEIIEMNRKIRQAIKSIGADKVKLTNIGWEALWYQHPRNSANNGHYVFIGGSNTDAINYLRGSYCIVIK